MPLAEVVAFGVMMMSSVCVTGWFLQREVLLYVERTGDVHGTRLVLEPLIKKGD